MFYLSRKDRTDHVLTFRPKINVGFKLIMIRDDENDILMVADSRMIVQAVYLLITDDQGSSYVELDSEKASKICHKYTAYPWKGLF